MSEEKPQKIPKDFVKFYQEMKALIDVIQKKLEEDFQRFYIDINARIKTLEEKSGKVPASLPPEKNTFDLKYTTEGFVHWTDEERTAFEKALIDLMVKHRAFKLTASVSMKPKI